MNFSVYGDQVAVQISTYDLNVHDCKYGMTNACFYKCVKCIHACLSMYVCRCTYINYPLKVTHYELVAIYSLKKIVNISK